MSNESLTVGQVAQLAGVTVRTLHHYDEIGLLSPEDRTSSGYRRYGSTDLERLQRILLFRELDFSLEAIGQLLDDPAFDPVGALTAQRELLEERSRRTRVIIDAVDRTLNGLKEGREMSADELFEGFEQAPYQEEAQERWGHTDAYKESMKRTKRFSKDDWTRVKAEGERIEQALADLMAAGHSPDSEEAMDQAEAARLHISNFYDCSHAMHVGLAEMYTADPRFEEHYEKRATGLAAYVAAAIRANAARAGVG